MRSEIKTFFKQHDPILYKVLTHTDDFELRASTSYFSDLCETIICQQLSDKVGTVLCRRFTALFPAKEITPQMLLDLPDETIRSIGSSRSKIAFMKDLAQKVIDNTIDLANLKHKSNQEIIDELVKVKGIGPWTAEMFLMSSLSREDVFSFGDLGLKRAIEKLYALEHEPSKEEMEEISNRWKPYRTYACKLLWKSLSL